jgi:hypothetical protein
LTFIPISCEILVEESTSSNLYEIITDEPQGTRPYEIQISTLNGSMCGSSGSFYDMLDLSSLFYTTNPVTAFRDPSQVPQIDIERTVNNGLMITIPALEQKWFNIKTDIHLKVVLKYTNTAFSELVQTGHSTFQDFFFTLRFNRAAQTVNPEVAASQTLLMQGDDLVVSAADTFIENVDPGMEQDGLTFAWECSTSLQTYCEENSGS